MALSKYIRDLLYRYECVIIPDFGGFLTKTISAKLDERSHTLYPPSKRLGFNSQLTENDGLLANYIASVDKISYKTAVNFIKLEIEKWQTQLINQDVVLEEVGTFSLNSEKKIVFEPDPNTNFLTDSFGLTSLVAPTVSRADYMNEEVIFDSISDVLAEEEIFVNAGKINRSISPFFKYAATFAILLTIGYFLTKQIINNNKLGKQVAEFEEDQETLINKRIQEATFEITKTLPAITIKVNSDNLVETETGESVTGTDVADDNTSEEVTSNDSTTENLETSTETTHQSNQAIEKPTELPSTNKYHVIAGAFAEPTNATKKLAQLEANGYEARIVGINKRKLTQVAFGSYPTMEEAQNTLNKIRKTVAKDAWILVK